MNKPQPELRVKTLDQAIELAVAQFPANVGLAADALEDILRVNAELMTASRDYLLHVAARTVIGQRMRSGRESIKRDASSGMTQHETKRQEKSSSDRAIADSKPAYRLSGAVTLQMRKTWLDFSVPCVGKLLGKMTLDDLDKASRLHAAFGDTHIRTSNFLAEVSKWTKKKAGKIVGDVLDHTDIQGIALKTGFVQ